MKPIFLIVIMFTGLCMSAQKNISINHSINDDGKKLDIKIKGLVNGKTVDYDHSFDVSGMNKDERDAIKRNIYDSLGLPDPTVATAPPSSTAALELINSSDETDGPRLSSKDDLNEFYTIGGKHPYTKEIRYTAKTGKLFMKYRFQKAGKSVVNEKFVDAKNKTKEQRQQIIKSYENEIGFRPQLTS